MQSVKEYPFWVNQAIDYSLCDALQQLRHTELVCAEHALAITPLPHKLKRQIVHKTGFSN